MQNNKAQELGYTPIYVYYSDGSSKNNSSDLFDSQNDSYSTEENKNLILSSIENSQFADTATLRPKEDKTESTTADGIDIPVKIDLYSVLSSVLEDEVFESGIINHSEEIFLKEFGEDELGALNAICRLFMDNIANTGRKLNNLIGILHMLSHLDYNKVYPSGQMLAICAINHKNNEVAEYGIKCFENWGEKDGIDKLNSIRFSSLWLQEYANEVVEELKNG